MSYVAPAQNCHQDSNVSVDDWIPFAQCSNSKFARSQRKQHVADFHPSSDQRFITLHMKCPIASSCPDSSRCFAEIKDKCSNRTISTVRVCDQGFGDLKLLKTQKANFRIIMVRYRVWGYSKSPIALFLAASIPAFKLSTSSLKDFLSSSNLLLSLL